MGRYMHAMGQVVDCPSLQKAGRGQKGFSASFPRCLHHHPDALASSRSQVFQNFGTISLQVVVPKASHPRSQPTGFYWRSQRGRYPLTLGTSEAENNFDLVADPSVQEKWSLLLCYHAHY